VTKGTALKLYGTDIEFRDLRVGDRISIAGVAKGSKGDLEATSITRQN
jgi:hypothetical protein